MILSIKINYCSIITKNLKFVNSNLKAKLIICLILLTKETNFNNMLLTLVSLIIISKMLLKFLKKQYKSDKLI